MFCLMILSSCGQGNPNEQIDEGRVKGERYASKEIGWAIEIPTDWTVISRDKLEANEAKGKEAIEQSTGLAIEAEGLKHLISFQKNPFNIFTSSSQPFTEQFEGEYQQSTKQTHEIIYQTYTDQGIKSDSSSGIETIQGLVFNTFYTTIYAPNGDVIIHQIIYTRLINGYDFSVNINYNNDEDKKIMVDALKKSTFTARQGKVK